MCEARWLARRFGSLVESKDREKFIGRRPEIDLTQYRLRSILTGGDKSGQWETWYVTAIPLAGQLYTDYLDELRSEGLIDPNNQ